MVREAYRKQKFVLVEKLLKKNKSMNLMLVYTLPSILSFTDIEDKISVTLQRLVEEIWMSNFSVFTSHNFYFTKEQFHLCLHLVVDTLQVVRNMHFKR